MTSAQLIAEGRKLERPCAVLAGWHLPFPDSDWKDLVDEQLIAMTIRDSEPWVEVWRNQRGEFKVIQRTT